MGLHQVEKVVRMRWAFSGRLATVYTCYAPKFSLLASLIQPWGVNVSITHQKRKFKLTALSRRNITTRKPQFFFALSSKRLGLTHVLHRNRVRICRRSRRRYKKKVQAIRKQKLKEVLEGSDDIR